MILDDFRLDGKVALVTGASRGLGAAIAVGLAEAGADVACHGNTHSPDVTCATVSQTGRHALAVIGDLEDAGAPEAIVNQVLGRFGQIDILVNNAGIIRRAPAADYFLDDWRAVLEVNLTSLFRLCQLAGRRMLTQGWGKILNIASLLSFQGGVNVPAYAAAKGGVAQLTKALANEWAGKNVNVNAIAPGYMITDNTTALRKDETRNRQILERIPAGRWGDPADLAGAAVFLCSEASRYVHGQILAVDGGWLAR
jgi:2-dehydro-3-deoxy-D-gluconate 5-dehydrogenase